MIGRTISHYRIDRRLGAGGMGEVYLARDLAPGSRGDLDGPRRRDFSYLWVCSDDVTLSEQSRAAGPSAGRKKRNRCSKGPSRPARGR